MFRQRVIMAIGEAILRELPDRDTPVGLAVEIPQYAVAAGHKGVAITRLGQDPAGDRLVELLRESGVAVEHVQRDPDLATAREVSRRGELIRPRDSEILAFDNLQWDFDLVDAGQIADAVVFGAFAMRTGQARSTIDRFLSECTLAFRLANLATGNPEHVTRESVEACLRGADVVLADAVVLKLAQPSIDPADWDDAAARLLKRYDLRAVVVRDAGLPWRAVTTAGVAEGPPASDADRPEAGVIGLLHGMLAGWSDADTLALAARLDAHAGGDEIPPAWLATPGSA